MCITIKEVKNHLEKGAESGKKSLESFAFISLLSFITGLFLSDTGNFPKNIELMKEKQILVIVFGVCLLTYPAIVLILDIVNGQRKKKKKEELEWFDWIYVLFFVFSVAIGGACGWKKVGIEHGKVSESPRVTVQDRKGNI